MQPSAAPRSSQGRPPLRALVALVLAGALALEVAVSLARAPAGSGDDVGRIEQDLLPLRPALRPGDRVALVSADEQPVVLRATQYVLAPALVTRASRAPCWAGEATCADGATYLLVSGAPVSLAAAFGARLGFVPVAVAPGGVLLQRGGR